MIDAPRLHPLAGRLAVSPVGLLFGILGSVIAASLILNQVGGDLPLLPAEMSFVVTAALCAPLTSLAAGYFGAAAFVVGFWLEHRRLVEEEVARYAFPAGEQVYVPREWTDR